MCISHFLNTIASHQIVLDSAVWRFYNTSPTPQKGISFFYNLFQNKLQFVKSQPFSKWETDLGVTITEVQWQQAFRSLYKASRCINHWELSQKIALRWYLTPYRMSKFGKHSSAFVLEKLRRGREPITYVVVL